MYFGFVTVLGSWLYVFLSMDLDTPDTRELEKMAAGAPSKEAQVHTFP